MTRRLPIDVALWMAIAAILVGCGGPPTDLTASPVSLSSPDSPVITPPAAPDANGPSSPEVREAIVFREEFGLRSDVAWVLSVAAHPDATMEFGVPLLPFERDEIERRSTGGDALVGAIRTYLEAHSDISGGLYIDQRRGGIVTVLVTEQPEAHRAALREVVGAGTVFDVRQVRWSEAELMALQDRVSAAMPGMAAIPARFVSSSIDVIGNVVEVQISSAAPDAAARIATAVGAKPGQLEVSSDGTGLLLQPTGRIRGKIVAPAGVDVTALSPQYESDVPIGIRDAVGIIVGADGSFLIDRLPPTTYTVTILAIADAGNKVVGSARVTVPPGGTARIEIPVTRP